MEEQNEVSAWIQEHLPEELKVINDGGQPRVKCSLGIARKAQLNNQKWESALDLFMGAVTQLGARVCLDSVAVDMTPACTMVSWDAIQN